MKLLSLSMFKKTASPPVAKTACVFFLSFLFSLQPCFADTSTMKINIKAVVTFPPCAINFNQSLDFALGDIHLNKNNNSDFFVKTINIPVNCMFDEPLNVTWKGKTIPINANGNILPGSIATNEYDHNHVYLTLSYLINGARIPVDINKTSLLSTSVYKYPSRSLPIVLTLGRTGGALEAAGHFSATATLSIEYQ